MEDRLLRQILDSLPALREGAGNATPRVVLGPGDDAAAFCWPDGGTLLLTTDAAEEGVHFDRRLHPLRSVGRRAVAAAVSDVAAMGGRPLGLVISLVAPPRDEGAAAEIAGAAGQRAAELEAPVVGGNITAGARLGFHVAVAGSLPPGASPLRRSGALAGDGLFVTGELGGAALGLQLLRKRADGKGVVFGPDEERLAARQLDPAPRLTEGLALRDAARAGMDISDGLALDLHRLAAASGVGAVVEAARLPLAFRGAGGLDAALFGGEDYELLVSGPEDRILAAASAANIQMTRIGRTIGAAEGLRLQRPGGISESLPARGWDSGAAVTDPERG